MCIASHYLKQEKSRDPDLLPLVETEEAVARYPTCILGKVYGQHNLDATLEADEAVFGRIADWLIVSIFSDKAGTEGTYQAL